MIQNPGTCTKCGEESRNRNWSHGVCEWCRTSEAMEQLKTTHIIVLGDGETWEGLPGAEIWEVTEEAVEELMEGEKAWRLDDSKILSRKEIS